MIRGPLRRALRHRQGPGLQDEARRAPRRRTSRSGRRRSCRDPDSLRAHLKADELQALPPDLAARDRLADGAQGARDHDGRARRRATTGCAPRRRGPCSTGSPGSTPRARTTRAEEAERTLPPLQRGRRRPASLDVTPTQHFTEPPPRFTEATLIKALEEHGIGRPSTYAATISTIVDRGYVRVEERRLHPEEIGEIVTDFLVAYFSEYVDLAFTARMEEELDEVAERRARVGAAAARVLRPAQGAASTRSARSVKRADITTEADRRGLLARATRWSSASGRNGEVPRLLHVPRAQGDAAAARARRRPKLEGDGEPCPQCGEGVLATKRGRFGAFVGCSRYPDCTYIRKDGPPPPDQLPFEVVCPKNGDGKLVARRARRTGNVFWGCSSYPKCDFTTNDEPTGADPRRPRRRQRARSRAQGRERPVPDLRRDGGAARGRPGRPAPGRVGRPNPAALRAAGARRPAWRRRGAARGAGARAGRDPEPGAPRGPEPGRGAAAREPARRRAARHRRWPTA